MRSAVNGLRWALRHRMTVVGRALCVVAVVAFLLAALAGNSWARHLGGNEGAFALTNNASQAVNVGRSDFVEAPLLARAADEPAPAKQGQHVLHMLGACTAVLGVQLLLLFLRLRRAWLLPLHVERNIDILFRPDVQEDRRWKPPPLSPPTSSPVMRT